MKLSFKKVQWRQLIKKMFLHWLRHYKLLFSVAFLSVSALGGYQWYQNLYRYAWTLEERKAYLDQTIQATVFHERQFLEVLAQLEQIRREHTIVRTPERDIFVGAKKEKTVPR